MATLEAKRCRNHPTREAVARCMDCMDYFCRECIVEHEGRMTCKDCLETVEKVEAPKQRQVLRFVMHTGLAVVSFCFCYLVFFALGRVLISLAESFYEMQQW